MPKRETRPIWRLLVVCYFLPLMIALLLGSNGNSKPNVGFVLAIAVVALLSLVLFLKLKQWEYSWKKKALQAQQSQSRPQEIGPTKIEVERYLEELKQKEEYIFQMTAESREKFREKEECIEAKEKMIEEGQEKLEVQEKNFQELIQKLQGDLLEKQLHTQMQEGIISSLRMEIVNLNFELRTVLKVEGKNYTAPS